MPLPAFQNKSYSNFLSSGQKTLQLAWQSLARVQRLSFSAASKSDTTVTGWNGHGQGSVEVKCVDATTLLFLERGSWQSGQNQSFAFSNVFRWTLTESQQGIRLEHLRFGAHQPVFLFLLVPTDAHTLTSLKPHVCKDDAYFGQLCCDDDIIQLSWRVLGPKKNEAIDYRYLPL